MRPRASSVLVTGDAFCSAKMGLVPHIITSEILVRLLWTLLDEKKDWSKGLARATVCADELTVAEEWTRYHEPKSSDFGE